MNKRNKSWASTYIELKGRWLKSEGNILKKDWRTRSIGCWKRNCWGRASYCTLQQEFFRKYLQKYRFQSKSNVKTVIDWIFTFFSLTELKNLRSDGTSEGFKFGTIARNFWSLPFELESINRKTKQHFKQEVAKYELTFGSILCHWKSFDALLYILQGHEPWNIFNENF